MSLVERQLFGIKDLVRVATNRILEFEAQALKMSTAGYYVAFSGGKDSIVALDLVRRAGVKHTVHFHITSVDPPELIRFIRKYYSADVIWEHPRFTMWQLIIEKMMPPTRVVRYCCEYLKEYGGKGRAVVTGIRWAESNRRKSRNVFEQCLTQKTKYFLNPIIDWSDTEVWQYIRENKLPYCSLYDEGFKRIGCVGCPLAGQNRVKEFERWPKYEAAYKRAFAAAAAANRASLGIEFGGKGRLAKLRWSDGEDMFRWWMTENRCRTADEQLVLFE